LKPLIVEDVLSKIHRLFEYRRLAWETQMLRREVDAHYELDQMVIRSPAMKEIVAVLHKVAPTNSTVLIRARAGSVKRWWPGRCMLLAHAATSSFSR
jgi:DNA-binding NtrC family response regulator